MFLTLLQSSGGPPPPIVLQRGGYAPERKRKDRTFKEEREQREQLSALIRSQFEISAEPIEAKQEAPAKVAIRPKSLPSAIIEVPPAFNVAKVSEEISQAINKAIIEARKISDEIARQKARAIFEEMVAAEMRRIAKRRRDEEILLLM